MDDQTQLIPQVFDEARCIQPPESSDYESGDQPNVRERHVLDLSLRLQMQGKLPLRFFCEPVDAPQNECPSMCEMKGPVSFGIAGTPRHRRYRRRAALRLRGRPGHDSRSPPTVLLRVRRPRGSLAPPALARSGLTCNEHRFWLRGDPQQFRLGLAHPSRDRQHGVRRCASTEETRKGPLRRYRPQASSAVRWRPSARRVSRVRRRDSHSVSAVGKRVAG